MKVLWLFLYVALGVGVYFLLPKGCGNQYMPVNAKCLNCGAKLHVDSGVVLCSGCNHLMNADSARNLFNATPGLPRIEIPAQKLNGPIPSDVSVLYPH